MENFKKILVLFDGSENAKRALSRAVYLAELCGAKLSLLHAVDLNKNISALEQVSIGGYVPSELKEEGYQILANAMHQLPKGIQIEIIVNIGRSEVIIDSCRDGEYDLIVMGSRGFGKLKQLFMGSVSQYVLYYADCPVMIVR